MRQLPAPAFCELFEFTAIKQAKSQSMIPTDENGVNYIVQSTRNNMFSRKVNEQWLIDHNEVPVDGNCIVLGVTLPAVSYQPDRFGASQVIVARADFLNEAIGLWFVAMLEKQMVRFSYSSKPSLKAYREMSIKLPVKETEEIDWEYMQERITELEQERITELEHYLIATGLNDYELTDEDKDILATKLTDGGGYYKTRYLEMVA